MLMDKSGTVMGLTAKDFSTLARFQDAFHGDQGRLPLGGDTDIKSSLRA